MTKKTPTQEQIDFAARVADAVAFEINQAVEQMRVAYYPSIGTTNIRETWINMQANISAERIRTALLDVLTEFND